MDDLWNFFINNFENLALPYLPTHVSIINKLRRIILSGAGIFEIQNILLYGPPGFPVNLLWESVFKEMFGTNYHKNVLSWHNKLNYIETPYFFEIDMSDPNNTKDLDTLSVFLKEIVQHPCVHSTRHIIILHNIEKLCGRRSSYSFRVLLERYSQNAIFICTTHCFGSIEGPLISRCINIRIPLPTIHEITNIMHSLKLNHHPLLIQNECRDIFFTLYIHWLSMHMPEMITEEFCNYDTMGIAELLKNKKKTTIEENRLFVSKISVHDPTLSSLTMDIIKVIPNKKKIMEFIKKAAEIEYMCSTTEGHRKPLYIELLLNIAMFDS